MRLAVLVAVGLQIICVEALYGQKDWNPPGPYVAFDLLPVLNQLWVLEEESTSDTVLLHVQRKGSQIHMKLLRAVATFPFQSAMIESDSISHLMHVVHMTGVHETKFILNARRSKSRSGSRLLGIMTAGPRLQLMQSVESLDRKDVSDNSKRVRSFRLVASSPFEQPDTKLLAPPACILSLGKWRVLESKIDKSILDTVIITAQQGMIVVTTIGKAGDTTSVTSVDSRQIRGDKATWWYKCRSVEVDGINAARCELRFHVIHGQLLASQMILQPGLVRPGIDTPFRTWNAKVLPESSVY